MTRLSQLLGARVRSESGQRLGHVFDVRAAWDDRSAVVEGLVVGRTGLLERLGIPKAPRARASARGFLPWDAVVAIEGRTVVVREGTAVGDAGSEVR